MDHLLAFLARPNALSEKRAQSFGRTSKSSTTTTTDVQDMRATTWFQVRTSQCRLHNLVIGKSSHKATLHR